ncbi:MAG: dienelactone hydrolase family protein, partial [Hyphomicrobiales bacterium]|nr:dienelactone hydrolase family protein [Hyphomicrobiales bacterium]
MNHHGSSFENSCLSARKRSVKWNQLGGNLSLLPPPLAGEGWHFLQRLPECNGKVGAVGYCLGGKLCYLMCCRTDIGCAVAYYGTYIEHHIRETKNLHRPFVLHALKDRWVQAEVNELLERRLSPNPLVTIHK